jgi:S-(hydroxymethyl)glutathione dehydrogenase/alcohol dehydrogenase
MQARAIVTEGKGSFVLDEVEISRPLADEVLIGVCHTDFDCMSIWRDREPRPEDFLRVGPRAPTYIMGHEGAGVVLETGSRVDHVTAGDRVLLNWAISCGECFQCQQGAESICEKRHQVPNERFSWRGRKINTSFGLGTMASHALVPKQAVVKIDVEIPFTSACILGCGVMTGFGSAVNAAKVTPGSTVVVLGCGGVGLSVMQGALYREAAKIIAVDIRESRLELAKRFGATETLLASRDDDGLLNAAKQVRALTGGRGADYTFECTAVPELGPAPLAFTRNGGTAVGVSGIEQTIRVNMELFEWDKLYINPLYGQCKPSRDFPLLLRLYREKRLKLDEMVTRTYRLEDLDKAFKDMHDGSNAKGVLVIR